MIKQSFRSKIKMEVRTMKSVIENAFKDVSKEDLISSRQHTMTENVKLSNELFRVRQLVKKKILDYENKIIAIKKEEETKYTFMAISNLQYELEFYRTLLG